MSLRTLFEKMGWATPARREGHPRKGRMGDCAICGTQHVMDRTGHIAGAAAERRHNQLARKADRAAVVNTDRDPAS